MDKKIKKFIIVGAAINIIFLIAYFFKNLYLLIPLNLGYMVSFWKTRNNNE